MTIQKIIALAVKIEGKKSSIKICDAREFMAILRKLCKDDTKSFMTVVRYLSGE